MTTRPQRERRAPGAARRILTRAMLTIAGIIGGLFCYFVCQGNVLGLPAVRHRHPQRHRHDPHRRHWGTAWIIDHRRIDARD